MLDDKIIKNVVRIVDVAKVRDKLVNLFNKEKSKMCKEEEEMNNGELKECVLDWVIDEINDNFDFDGEEEELKQQLKKLGEGK